MWKQKLEQIRPVSQKWIKRAHERWDSLTKPKKSLGRLEDIVARVVAIREEEFPPWSGPWLPCVSTRP